MLYWPAARAVTAPKMTSPAGVPWPTFVTTLPPGTPATARSRVVGPRVASAALYVTVVPAAAVVVAGGGGVVLPAAAPAPSPALGTALALGPPVGVPAAAFGSWLLCPAGGGAQGGPRVATDRTTIRNP